MPTIVLRSTGSSEYSAIGSAATQNPVLDVARKNSTSTPIAGAAWPMLASANTNGAANRAQRRVSTTPSGTPTSTTIAVTAMASSRCRQVRSSKVEKLMLRCSMSSSCRVATHTSRPATAASTTTGCANIRIRSARSAMVVLLAQLADGVHDRVDADRADVLAARADHWNRATLGEDRLQRVLQRGLLGDQVVHRPPDRAQRPVVEIADVHPA